MFQYHIRTCCISINNLKISCLQSIETGSGNNNSNSHTSTSVFVKVFPQQQPEIDLDIFLFLMSLIHIGLALKISTCMFKTYQQYIGRPAIWKLFYLLIIRPAQSLRRSGEGDRGSINVSDF